MSNKNREIQKLVEGFEDMPLEDMLEVLCYAGNPRVSKGNNGWLCSLEVHIPALGTSITVRSDFGRECPSSATRQCASRLLDSFESISL